VLVIDEPLVGLDPRTARIVKDLMRKRADEGATVFVSTHSLAMVEEISDRIGILDRGCLKAIGTLDELRGGNTGRSSTLESLFLELTATGKLTAEPSTNGDEVRNPEVV
jgi:ABC-2 type transport system ATP-binding protein